MNRIQVANQPSGRVYVPRPIIFKASLASDHLDMIRGLAAVGVFLGHARMLFLVDYTDIKQLHLTDKLLYFATGFGQQQVMVFFVLSGFFIGSSIVKVIHLSQWSWSSYLTNRLTRLYVVLLPALLLTLFWDHISVNLAGTQDLALGLGPDSNSEGILARLTAITFFGNVLFLQRIFVETLGSNGPLWSLTNEFWYYILFPCVCLVAMQRKCYGRKAICLLLGVTIVFFGWDLMPLFPGLAVWSDVGHHS